MWTGPLKTADLFTFTKEILNLTVLVPIPDEEKN